MLYPQMKILETENCILRPVTVDDYIELYEYYKVPDVVKFLPVKKHKSYVDTKKFIKTFFINNYEKGKIGHYAIVLKQNDKVIGNVGFNNISKNAQNAELGICLNPNYWGNNLSIELVEVLIEYGFRKLNLEYIYAITYEDNIYSRRILDKLNFKHEKDFNRKFKNTGSKTIKCSKYILYNKDYTS